MLHTRTDMAVAFLAIPKVVDIIVPTWNIKKVLLLAYGTYTMSGFSHRLYDAVAYKIKE